MHKNNPVFLMTHFCITLCIAAAILFSCRIDDSDSDDPDDENISDITVSIDQSGIVIYTGQSFQFSATVQNTEDNRVTWSLSSTVNMDRGIINEEGLYLSVPMDVLAEDVVTVTVTATSLEDPSVSGSLDFLVEKRCRLVADIKSGAGWGQPAYMTVYNNRLYFNADGANGNEFWCYDGNAVEEVADINNGAEDSNPNYFTVFNNKLYFMADGGNGYELWYYDGHDLVEIDINAGGGSSPVYLTVFHSKLYFSADGDNGHGRELWCYDGTNPPEEAADINIGGGSSQPCGFIVYDDKLCFVADMDGDIDPEFFYYDGINPPVEIDIDEEIIDNPNYNFAVFNEKLYFVTYDNNWIDHLWCYDGNKAVKIDSSCETGERLIVYHNRLYFQASSNGHGYELWCYDGTSPPYEVADIYSDGSSSPTGFTVFNNKLFFNAQVGNNTNELWCYDDSMPVEEGINPFEIDINRGNEGSKPSDLTVYNNKLYFCADGGDGHGRELWVCSY